MKLPDNPLMANKIATSCPEEDSRSDKVKYVMLTISRGVAAREKTYSTCKRYARKIYTSQYTPNQLRTRDHLLGQRHIGSPGAS